MVLSSIPPRVGQCSSVASVASVPSHCIRDERRIIGRAKEALRRFVGLSNPFLMQLDRELSSSVSLSLSLSLCRKRAEEPSRDRQVLASCRRQNRSANGLRNLFVSLMLRTNCNEVFGVKPFVNILELEY